MWMRCSFSHSHDSLRSSLSKAKYPIHLHEGYINCEAVHSCKNANTQFIGDPCSLFRWLVTVRRPRCVITSFSTKCMVISIVEAKYYTFIFALGWWTQTLIESTSRNIILYTRRRKRSKMMWKWFENDVRYSMWHMLHVTHVACRILFLEF